MTDNEIIKALECCSNEGLLNCHYCPYDKHCDMGSVQMQVDILNLIKRQKAEIEEMEAEIDKQYEQAKADILGNMADGGASCHWCIEQHRLNAFKEFASELKQMSCGYSFESDESNQTYQMIDIEDIDDLLERKLKICL